MIQPPEKFGLVEPDVYRSAFPTPESFAHVRLLSLRTVINLSREALTRPATVFLAENNIQLVDVGLQVWTHPACTPVSHELITEAMRYVLDRAHHPLLICSASGTHQVGALVGCLRRLQQWSLSATLDEYRRYAAPSPRAATEQFIELFDCDLLALPVNLPPWFERQAEMLDEDAQRWRDAQAASQHDVGWHRSGSHCSILSAEPDGAASGASDAETAASPMGLAVVGAPAATSISLGVPLVSSHDSLPWWQLGGDVGPDGITPMKVTGPLVPPGTKTSTIDAED